MAGTGTALLDFGAFGGASDASVAVSAPSILAGSLVEAWLFPADTADHLADEHRVETISVMAGSVVAGVGFTIYGQNTSQLNEPVLQNVAGRSISTGQAFGAGAQDNAMPSGRAGGAGTLIYGKWNVAWVWPFKRG